MIKAILLFPLVALLAFGCGSYDKDNSTRAARIFDSLKLDKLARHPGQHTVEIRDMVFDPETIVVKTGDTVVWINHDMLAHDVTEEASKKWMSGRMEAGATWQRTFSESADYFCSLHAVMKGKVIVRPSHPLAIKSSSIIRH